MKLGLKHEVKTVYIKIVPNSLLNWKLFLSVQIGSYF